MRRRFKNIMIRIKYKLKFEGWSWLYAETGESWRRFKIFGIQNTYDTGSSHDCSGRPFCWCVDKYLFGLVTVGYYAIDV